MSGKYGDLEQKFGKSIEHYKKELGRMRGGRATPQILEGITVEYYGSQVPLNQVGLVSAPEPRLLTVQVYDGSAVEAVEKAIMSANLGLNPSRDGALVRVAIPALNEQRRKDLIKTMHEEEEKAKVVVRGHRRDAVEGVKKAVKDKSISEDDSRRQQDDIQKLTDKCTLEIETLTKAKEKEMMAV